MKITSLQKIMFEWDQMFNREHRWTERDPLKSSQNHREPSDHTGMPPLASGMTVDRISY